MVSERRRHGRLRTDDLGCSLGEVFDLSASGMRVDRRGRKLAELGDTFSLRLAYGDVELYLDCKVVRLWKVGFRKYSYGLEFVGVEEETLVALTVVNLLLVYTHYGCSIRLHDHNFSGLVISFRMISNRWLAGDAVFNFNCRIIFKERTNFEVLSPF